jgi:hypothetical protein
MHTDTQYHHNSILSLLSRLRHSVQRTTVLEPLDLALVESVVEFNVKGLTAVCWMHTQRHRLTDCQLGAHKVDLVIWLDLIVVLGVGKGKRKHTLLLEVGFVDTCERPNDDCESTEMSGLERGVLARGAFAVVPVADYNPLDALLLVIAGSCWNSVRLTSSLVLNFVRLTVGLVNGTDEHVVGDVVKVTAILEPGASHYV